MIRPGHVGDSGNAGMGRVGAGWGGGRFGEREVRYIAESSSGEGFMEDNWAAEGLRRHFLVSRYFHGWEGTHTQQHSPPSDSIW